MIKTTIYGLPLNPTPLLNELRGASFCVSFATREKLGKQLDQAIELVGEDGILMIDNGAFSIWQKALKTGADPVEAGKYTMTDEYLDAWEAWAQDILDRCPQAVAVVPDVIMGTLEQNRELLHTCQLDWDRCMPVWHMDEPLSWLQHLAQEFQFVAFGSTVAFKPNSPEWHARIQAAFAAIDEACEPGSGYVRPRIHMMRAQAQAHLYDFDSSDSTNVAVNHNRQLKKAGEDLSTFAGRVRGKIEASCDMVEAEHQTKQPLLYHLEAKAWREQLALELLMESVIR